MISNRQQKLNRRSFLKGTLLSGTIMMIPEVMPASVLGLGGEVAPNSKIALGGIGIRNRGFSDLQCFFNIPDIRFCAICDIRKDQRERIKSEADKVNNASDCAMYKDMEDLLSRSDIDAVLIATGDRWHTMASITAARYGKDIYCEKPLSLTIQESRALADVIESTGVIYQAGTQRRNVENFQLAAELAHSGKLGKLTEVHANTLWPATLHEWFPAEEMPAPEEIDWDRWLGPCPWRPYNKRYVDGQWRNHFDFHGGGILEWGSHTVDLCQWAAQKDNTVPVEYVPQFKKDGSIAGHIFAYYADGLKLVMRESGWRGLGSCSAQYVGTEGWVETGDSGNMEVSSDSLRKELKVPAQRESQQMAHIREFVGCIKTRMTPSANAKVAANSHIACHCAYIAWQLGRALKFDPVKEEFINDEQANRMRARAMRGPYSL